MTKITRRERKHNNRLARFVTQLDTMAAELEVTSELHAGQRGNHMHEAAMEIYSAIGRIQSAIHSLSRDGQ